MEYSRQIISRKKLMGNPADDVTRLLNGFIESGVTYQGKTYNVITIRTFQIIDDWLIAILDTREVRG